MEFRKIFTHTDDDGDEISFFSDERSPLSVEVKPVGEQSYIGYLDRDAALRLHAVLGEWLYPVHAPEGPNRSLIEQMIERAVKDQVAAVLPLHLKSFAAQMQAAEEKIGRVANALMADPEPRDVGHPEDCGLCGRDQDPNGHDCVPPKYEDARPGTTHEFVQGLRRMADAAKHAARATASECGKCGAPWSDTHGQPGDPCAPASSAPAPAGPTWDDELWGAPSAETGARTLPVPACTKCGHSWPRHRLLGGPTTNCSVRGCECTRVQP